MAIKNGLNVQFKYKEELENNAGKDGITTSTLK